MPKPLLETQFGCGLYALLAGCGPLRVGEALGLEIDKHISEDFRTLQIAQKAKARKIQPYLKTTNGERRVDICRPLAGMLRVCVGKRISGLLFCTSTGAQILQANTLQDSLHPILDYIGLKYGGFNIFRRFRLTHLETSGCPEALKHFWSGHAEKHISERYVMLAQESRIQAYVGRENRPWIRVARDLKRTNWTNS